MAQLLSPASQLYARVVARKIQKTEPVRAGCPVICIGNITMGGVGKTPFAGMIASFFAARQRQAHLLLRGYGGRARGPLSVQPGSSADEVGDEAVMLAQTWPVWISRDRPEGAHAAAAQGADIIILDDGFQNPSLYKDFSFLLVDGQTGLGNGRVFPSGPLRESPQSALKRAQAVVIVGGEKGQLPNGMPSLADLPVLHATIRADIDVLPKGKPVIAFAGIGRPEKFFDDMKCHGVPIVETHVFPDHHPYTVDELVELRHAADSHSSLLVTTEKDLMRLHPSQRDGILAVPARMTVEEEELLARLMAPIIARSDPS